MSGSSRSELATLAGGCFWCLEAVFERVEGVLEVRSGYAGGAVPDPSYRQVCSGTTGHAEAVQLRFDPDVISFREILEIFFAIHDPTTRDRQGADVGSQYRSAVFFHDEAQRDVTRAVIEDLESAGTWPEPVVTEIVPLDAFWVAEEYHQEYYRRNPDQPYCRVVVAPKVAKLRQRFAHRLRAAASD